MVVPGAASVGIILRSRRLVGVGGRPLNLGVRSAMAVSTSICDIVESWLRGNIERLGWKTVRFARDRDRDTLAAGYELAGALVSIGAWEQGFALDVDVLEVATGKVEMVCAGACADDTVVRSRLAAVAPWVTKHVRI